MESKNLIIRQPKYWGKKFTIEDVFIYLFLFVIFLITFYPFFYTLTLAVMPYDNYIKQTIHLYPTGFTLSAFREIFTAPNLARAFANSLLKTVLATSISVVLTVMTGYGLSRKGLKLSKVLIGFFVIPMWFGGGLIATYLVIRAVGILNTFWAMIIPGLVGSFGVFLVRAYYREYPQEIIEAAIVDGADHFQVFWQIIWPTSQPIIATMALLIGTGQWNDFFWPSLVVPVEWQPATVMLQKLAQTRSVYQSMGLGLKSVPQSFIAAIASMLIIPVLAVFPFLQKYVIKGMLIGSIKG
jgi:putative aldouronate transport system permease protein